MRPSYGRATPPRPAEAALAIPVALAFLVLVAHVFVNARTPYGFHRDEFLYMAMGEHLRLWHMDFPPFIAMAANVERALFGDTLTGLRALPAIAGALLPVMAALTARELGGNRFAQALAATAVAINPLFLRTGDLFQPVVFDELWWTLALLALARICRDGPTDATLSRRWPPWIALGVACGVGLLTKFSILFLAAPLFVALLLLHQRDILVTSRPWGALAIGVLIGSPSIAGQINLGFPVAGQMQDLHDSQLVHVSALTFITDQLVWGPTMLLGIAGALYLVFAPTMRRWRPVGLTCVLAFLLLLVLHGKAYYIGPIYPTLFAAGAIWLERATVSRVNARRRWPTYARAFAVAVPVLYIVPLMPLGFPVLPPAAMVRYTQRIGLGAAVRTNHGTVLALPQDYADMTGWREEVAAVARVYDSLPADVRSQAVIYAGNYGEAGAIDFYGPSMGLPRAVSAAGTYWFFGPGPKAGSMLLDIGSDPDDLAKAYGSVREVARFTNRWGVEEERDVPIYIATEPRTTLQAVWPSLAGQN